MLAQLRRHTRLPPAAGPLSGPRQRGRNPCTKKASVMTKLMIHSAHCASNCRLLEGPATRLDMNDASAYLDPKAMDRVFLCVGGVPYTTTHKTFSKLFDAGLAALMRPNAAGATAGRLPHAPIAIEGDGKRFAYVLGHLHGLPLPGGLTLNALTAVHAAAQALGVDSLKHQVKRAHRRLRIYGPKRVRSHVIRRALPARLSAANPSPARAPQRASDSALADTWVRAEPQHAAVPAAGRSFCVVS